MIPLRAGERGVADAIVALLADARVAIAAEDASLLPIPLPSNVVTFPRADFLLGSLPRGWLENLTGARDLVESETPAPLASAARSDATRRLRSVVQQAQPATRDASTVDAAELLADEIAWYRASGIGFSVAALSFAAADQLAAATALREALRSSDRVTADSDSCIVVLAGEPPDRAQRVVKRALAAVRKRLSLPARAAVRSIVVACPDDGEDAATLLERLRR